MRDLAIDEGDAIQLAHIRDVPVNVAPGSIKIHSSGMLTHIHMHVHIHIHIRMHEHVPVNVAPGSIKIHSSGKLTHTSCTYTYTYRYACMSMWM